MRAKYLYSGVVVGCVLLVQMQNGAQAWDGCGHKTVAAVAFALLKPETQQKINAVFSADTRGRHFIDAATWPDDIKLGKRNDLAVKAPLDKPWHFVDIPYDAKPQDIDQVIANHGASVDPAKENSANVVTAIRFFTVQLKSGAGDATAKADALSWLIHIVGDVHQPLHCVTVVDPLPNYTPPQSGDAGGNGFNIHHPARELHAFWDDSFDEPTGGRHEEGRDESDEHAQMTATQITPGNKPDQSLLAKTDPADWAKESYAVRTFAYSPALAGTSSAANPPHTITQAYADEERKDAEARAVLAGYRLAQLLETIYGQ